MAASSEPVEESDPREVMLAGTRIRFILTDVAVAQLFRVRRGVLDGWLATAFRLDKVRPVLRIHYAERSWLIPNHDYLIAEAGYVMEHRGMTRPLVMCGEFELEERTIRTYRERASDAARLWLKRIAPTPEVVLGYAEALDTDSPRFRPFASIWTDELCERAAVCARLVWADLQTAERERARQPGNDPKLTASSGADHHSKHEGC